MTSKRERLAQRRKAIGLSQEELAHRLGVERLTVVRWEAGETAPQPWLRPKLAETLGVSLDRLDALLADPDANANAGRGHPMPAPLPAANPLRPAGAGMGRDASKRQERRCLIVDLRRQGASTKQIALALCERYGVGRMTAFRWASDLSLAQAADRYNQLRDDPDQKMTGARISEWERWPQPRSRRPPVDALVTLSEVYNCHAGDLIDATDYGRAKQPSGAATPPPAPSESTAARQGHAKAAPSAPVGRDRAAPVAERAEEGLVEDAALAEAVAAARRQAGRELARLRSEAGLSQQDLANRIGYTRGQVGGAEAGSQATAPEFWQACDRVLAAGGALVVARARIEAAMKARRDAAARREEAKREARLQQWRTEHGLAPSRADDAESLLELEDPDLPEGAVDLREISDTTGWPGHVLEQRSIPSHRRQMIKLSGTFTVASLLELLSAEPDRMNEALDSGTVSDNRIQRFERIADELGLQAVKVAPTTLLADAAVNFRSVRRLVRQHQPTRFQIRLQRVGAKLGIVVGEILFIEGHFDLARQWYQAAQHAASEAGDRFLADIALASEAYLPTYSDDPQGVISLVTPRLEQRPSPTPAIAWLWAFKAKAHAQLGERAKFEQAITEAHAAMAGSTRELVCPGIYSFLPEKLAFYEATGYVRLRDVDNAVQATERALELYDLTDTTEPALVRFNKASALAESGEVPEACRVATGALLDRYTYPSVSVMTAARDFDRLLGTDRSTPVRDWRETLITVRRKRAAMARPGPGA